MKGNFVCNRWKQFLICFFFLFTAIGNESVQSTSIDFPPIIAAPSGSQIISDLDLFNACGRLPLGGYGVNSSGTTFLVLRYCSPSEIDP